MRVSLIDLIEQLKVCTNPVTRWSLKICIIDRINRESLD